MAIFSPLNTQSKITAYGDYRDRGRKMAIFPQLGARSRPTATRNAAIPARNLYRKDQRGRELL